MTDLSLFRVANLTAIPIPSAPGGLERPLQALVEKNLQTMLGIRFVASEHSTGKIHGGRIDTLGLDENGCPVILEYKRNRNENVINQGLYYLDWLMDHKADFTLLVRDRFDRKTADEIDWSGPRLVCIAGDFTRHDEHAVRQIPRNIDLVRYRRFGDDLLVLELLTSTSVDPVDDAEEGGTTRAPSGGKDKVHDQIIAEMAEPIRTLFDSACRYIRSLGDDVTEKRLKRYIAFSCTRNIVCLLVQKQGITLWLKLDPKTVPLRDGFTRDVTGRGHLGTGDLEVWIKDDVSLREAIPLIDRAYEAK